jgi:hypothetical protein
MLVLVKIHKRVTKLIRFLGSVSEEEKLQMLGFFLGKNNEVWPY